MSGEREVRGTDELFWTRVEALVRLKDYALSSNLDLSDEVLEDINHLVSGDISSAASRGYTLDRCIRDVTEITYPTTIETIGLDKSKYLGIQNKFLWIIAIFGIIMLILAVVARSVLSALPPDSTTATFALESFLTACLGTLGALVYIFFNLIGVLSEKAFSSQDMFTNSLRLVIGAIVGWLCYFAFLQGQGLGEGEKSMLLLPFLAGFSTRLVVGIITQAISAVELTLGLEDKSTDLRRRRLRAQQETAQAERISRTAMRDLSRTIRQSVDRRPGDSS